MKILLKYKGLQNSLNKIIPEFPGNEEEKLKFIQNEHEDVWAFIHEELSQDIKDKIPEFEELIQDKLEESAKSVRGALARFCMTLALVTTIAPNQTLEFVERKQSEETENNPFFSKHPDFKP